MNHIQQKRKLALTVTLALSAFGAFGFSHPHALSEPSQRAKVWRPTKIPAGVNFTGSQACVECHKSKVAVQEKSSMGLALEFVAESPILSSNQRLTFRDGKFTYEIVRKGNQSIYTVTDGKETLSEPILYSFGQGKAGQTYLLKYAGDYYESRVSFYTDTKNLDLTLGYQDTRPQSAIEALGRKLPADEVMQCFNCHSTGAVSGNQLHLEKLAPGVRCEACHGPGGDHVAAGKAGQPNKDKIFNPSRLGGDELTQDFCGACHRSAEEIVMSPKRIGINGVRFQPYRIFGSKCYSDDRRISCAACHDPHESASHDEAFYDAKCLACHQSGRASGQPPSPSQSGEGRAAPGCKVGAKNCASCHMPKIDLPGSHFKFTDHRIRVAKPGEPYPY
ncbi:MAG TPA: multiheme c-type cytochrome [Blastocatellia bacterium]|nr:multiheme c-type cytochrome [Blastocatellia bacterium]